jgi:hypothetical protein
MEGISAEWRKTSYSTNNGGSCVEVALWRKASYSGNNGGGCVEAGVAVPGQVLVRDTTNRDGGTLSFTAAAWRVFAGQLKQG